MKKRLLSWLFVAGMLLTAAGCSNANNNKGNDGTAAADSSAAAGTSVSSGSTGSADDYSGVAEGPLVPGMTVPNFKAELAGGGEFILSENKDKVIFVNVWATWCPYCLREFPEIQRLADEYKDRVVFLEINFGETRDVVDDYIAKNDYTFTYAYDENRYLCSTKFPTSGIPYTVVIRDGKVVEKFSGAPRDAYGVYKSAIEEALGK